MAGMPYPPTKTPTDCTDVHRLGGKTHLKIREHLCNLWEALLRQKLLCILCNPWENPAQPNHP